MGSPIPENMLDGAEFSDSDSLETGVAGPMLRPSLDEEESGIVLQVPGPTCHLPLSPPERGTRSQAPTPPHLPSAHLLEASPAKQALPAGDPKIQRGRSGPQ